MTIVLGMDLGTTSTAAVAVDKSGRVVDVVRRTHDAEVPGLPAGYAEQDPRRHWTCALEVLRELESRLINPPRALGLTGQMHSVLTLDSRNEPLTNLITWQDRRANERVDAQATFLERLTARCPAADIARTGCHPAPGYAAVTLFVLQTRGEIPAGMTRAAQLADWVAARLCDAEVVTERSHAASTGVYDLERERWSETLIAAAELDESWFPPVIAAGSMVGTLCESAATATGLPLGLPVAVPIGDNQASVLGSVPQAEPAIQITIGTGGQINWPIDTFLRFDGMDTRPLPPDRLMLVGAGQAGGDAVAWVNRMARGWLSAFGAGIEPSAAYDTLLRLAEAVEPGANGLTCEPFFRGTRREPRRRGRFDGITTENMSPGHVMRAVLEGISRSLHACWDSSSQRPTGVRRIIGCGNGLEQNLVLAGILSGQFQLPVFVPQNSEAAACGAALLAGTNVGVWENLEEAGRTIQLRHLGEEPA